MLILVANFYQFKGATTLRKYVFEKKIQIEKNCQIFTIKYSD
jgi:hypothetical protein